jgi:hypothetical protein
MYNNREVAPVVSGTPDLLLLYKRDGCTVHVERTQDGYRLTAYSPLLESEVTNVFSDAADVIRNLAGIEAAYSEFKKRLLSDLGVL